MSKLRIFKISYAVCLGWRAFSEEGVGHAFLWLIIAPRSMPRFHHCNEELQLGTGSDMRIEMPVLGWGGLVQLQCSIRRDTRNLAFLHLLTA